MVCWITAVTSSGKSSGMMEISPSSVRLNSLKVPRLVPLNTACISSGVLMPFRIVCICSGVAFVGISTLGTALLTELTFWPSLASSRTFLIRFLTVFSLVFCPILTPNTFPNSTMLGLDNPSITVSRVVLLSLARASRSLITVSSILSLGKLSGSPPCLTTASIVSFCAVASAITCRFSAVFFASVASAFLSIFLRFSSASSTALPPFLTALAAQKTPSSTPVNARSSSPIFRRLSASVSSSSLARYSVTALVVAGYCTRISERRSS